MSKVIVINTEPVSFRHIGWFVKHSGCDLSLFEVVEALYAHPDAPEHAKIPVLEYLHRKTVRQDTAESASIELFETSQRNLNHQSSLNQFDKAKNRHEA